MALARTTLCRSWHRTPRNDQQEIHGRRSLLDSTGGNCEAETLEARKSAMLCHNRRSPPPKTCESGMDVVAQRQSWQRRNCRSEGGRRMRDCEKRTENRRCHAMAGGGSAGTLVAVVGVPNPRLRARLRSLSWLGESYHRPPRRENWVDGGTRKWSCVHRCGS